ncbi:MAG: SPOR domain-containing protein, partial [Mariprofundus sp.]
WRSNMDSRSKQPAASEAVAEKQQPEPAKTTPTTKAVTKTPAPATKPVKRPSATKPEAAPTQLSAFEVAPGTVKGWVLNIESVESRKKAERAVRRLKKIDINAEYVRVPVKGVIWFRVRVSGFNNEREAVTLKKFLKEYHGIDAWHSKLK